MVHEEALETFELELEDTGGRSYIGRLNGTIIAQTDVRVVYLTADERVVVHEVGQGSYWIADGPAEQLSSLLPLDEYLAVMDAIDALPVIDL